MRGEAAASDEVVGELRLVGLAAVLHEGGAVSFCSLTMIYTHSFTDDSLLSQLVATKAKVTSVPLSFKKRPASSIDTTSAPASSSVALPLRTSRAAKASLWAFTTNNPATIDESTLLTDEDLARPTLVKREDCDVKRTRKACKNCSCGLKELLLEEQDDLVQAGFAEPVATVAPKKKGVKKMSASVTSSCGNCYLGDAFRCGSCPYLGEFRSILCLRSSLADSSCLFCRYARFRTRSQGHHERFRRCPRTLKHIILHHSASFSVHCRQPTSRLPSHLLFLPLLFLCSTSFV